jgi:DNA-binding LacI/PurR family transcriptional regulator
LEKRIATIKDIAKALDISTSTVSRALRNHPDVSKKTKEMVQKLATKLEYEPNQIALSLKQHKTNTIGVIIPQTENKFYSKTISGIQEVVTQAGYQIMICQSHESFEVEKEILQTLVSSRVDGLIVALSAETDEFTHLKKY